MRSLAFHAHNLVFWILGWREVESLTPRHEGKLELLDTLFASIKNARPADASEIKGNLESFRVICYLYFLSLYFLHRTAKLNSVIIDLYLFSSFPDGSTPAGSPMHPRKSNMRRSLKNLFASAPKFQKTLKR